MWHPSIQPRPADERILPLHQADAGPADGVVEGEAEQGSRGPAVARGSLLFALGVLLPLLLCQRAHGRGSGGADRRRRAHLVLCTVALCLACSVDGGVPSEDGVGGASAGLNATAGPVESRVGACGPAGA